MKLKVDFDTDNILQSVKKPSFKKSLFDKRLVLLLVFQTFFLFLYHYLDKAYQTWDSAGHIGMSFLMADKIQWLFNGNSTLLDILKTSDYYPPFVQLTGAFLSLIFGYNTNVLLALTGVFFFLAIIFIYKNVFFLTKNKNKAILTALVFSLFPQIAEQSRIFLLDLPLIALLLMAFYYLLKSKALSKRKESIMFFILFSFVQLTKWYGFIFLAVPVLYVLSKTYLDKEKWKLKGSLIIKNIAIGSVFILILAIPWYVANYHKIIEYSAIFSQAEEDDPQRLMSIENFTYYPRRIITHQIMLLPTLVALGGLILFIRRKKKLRGAIIFSLFVPYFIFTFLIHNKNLRYLLPLVPVYAYLITYILYWIKAKFGKTLFISAITIVIAYQLFAFMFLSFNQMKPKSKILTPISMVLIGPFYNDYINSPRFYSYEPRYWPVRELLNFVVEDANYPKDKGLGVTPLFDQQFFSLASFEMIRREEHLNNVYVPVPYFQFDSFKSDADILNYFDNISVEYVLVPSNPGPSGLRNYAVLSQLIEYFGSYRNDSFVLIKKFKLPDGNYVRVFKRKHEGQTIKTYLDENDEESKVKTEVVCKNDAGKDTGVETIQLVPYHSYVFYTGDFAVNGYVKDYEQGTLYILRLENVPHHSNLDVYNLPHVGTSMCDYPQLNVDLTENIKKPLTESGHCGIDCQKVDVVTWKVGEPNFEEKIYTRESYPYTTDEFNQIKEGTISNIINEKNNTLDTDSTGIQTN